MNRLIAVVVFFFAFLFLANSASFADTSTSCSVVGTKGVDDALNQADAAIKRHDDVTAKADYDLAISKLLAIPWATSSDAGCNSTYYNYLKFVVTVHSLVVAMDVGRLDAIEAQGIEGKLLPQIYSLAHADPAMGRAAVSISLGANASDSSGAAYYRANNRDLWDRWSGYAQEISGRANKERIALHDPATDGCTKSDLDPEPLVVAGNAAFDVPAGTYAATVTVELSETGAVTNATVTKSSGTIAFDSGALLAARQTTYVPAIKACKRVPSTYVFVSNEQVTRQ